jgi:hypothetical protein
MAFGGSNLIRVELLTFDGSDLIRGNYWSLVVVTLSEELLAFGGSDLISGELSTFGGSDLIRGNYWPLV